MDKKYDMVSKALLWLVHNQQEQPGLEELAEYLGLSESHVQRTFQAYTGVSPKQFLQSLTRDQAMNRLQQGATVLEAALDSGLSGPGRLHDLLINTDAMTPGEARRRGEAVEMKLGFAQSPFGPAMVAWNNRGITFLAFASERSKDEVRADFLTQWPDARVETDESGAGKWIRRIFEKPLEEPLPLWLRGSPFQLQVWRALLEIPEGAHVSYRHLAGHVGKPRANRAVGTAVGRNPISWLIPCHRVITANAGLGGYRWGLGTKQAMIGVEAGR